VSPILAVLVASACLAQDQPTFRVPSRLVTAPTLVFSSDDRLVFGLERDDFRVFDNGRTQRAALETEAAPISLVVAVQATQDVRHYLRFISRVGSTVEALLVGATGEAAVLSYGADIKVLKPFESGDVQVSLRTLTGSGRQARGIDAGMRAIALLKTRPKRRGRVLLYIGQPMDSGSESNLAALRDEAERENVSVYALALPEVGKAFVSDTFSLEGLSSTTDRGGFKAGVDLGRLGPVLNRTAQAAQATDPFSILTSATGGTQFHFREQRELEDGISLIGVELRSAYVLSYAPNSAESGYHTIRVDVGVPGAKVHSRPGYWMK
jgi:VWFA-related protein